MMPKNHPRQRTALPRFRSLLHSLNGSPFIAYARLIRKLARVPEFAGSSSQHQQCSQPLNRQVRPTLNRCQKCGLPKGVPHVTEGKHDWVNDTRLPQWHGWHACRRGLGSNLYPLGGTDLVIQKILRHADVSTTQEYYIKGKTPDARKALVKLGKAYAKKSVGQTLTDSERTLNSDSAAMPGFVN